MEQLSWICYTCLILALSFLLTVVTMPQLLKLCRCRGYYDLPNDRKLHSDNIPRLGGVLFAPVMMVGVTASLVVKFCLQSMPLPFVSLSVGFVLTSTLLIYLVGLLARPVRTESQPEVWNPTFGIAAPAFLRTLHTQPLRTLRPLRVTHLAGLSAHRVCFTAHSQCHKIQLIPQHLSISNPDQADEIEQVILHE